MPHFRLGARYGIPLVLAITAAFFWNMGTRTYKRDLQTKLYVVTGTVDSSRTTRELPGPERVRSSVPHDLVKIREYPGVEFEVQMLPGKELVPGTPVRFEMRHDPGPTLDDAASSDNVLSWIKADSFFADGTVVYSVAEAKARRDAAIMRFRGISLLLWAVVVIWIGLLAWRHRVFLRSLRQPDGVSAVVDRLQRLLDRE